MMKTGIETRLMTIQNIQFSICCLISMIVAITENTVSAASSIGKAAWVDFINCPKAMEKMAPTNRYNINWLGEQCDTGRVVLFF